MNEPLLPPAGRSRFKGILAVEGRPSTDGRVIAEGALSWGDEPIPLHAGFGGPVVGKVTLIERDGQLLRCEGEISAEATVALGLAVGVDIDSYDVDPETVLDSGSDSIVTIRRGEIRSAAVTPEPAFPDAKIESKEEADG